MVQCHHGFVELEKIDWKVGHHNIDIYFIIKKKSIS